MPKSFFQRACWRAIEKFEKLLFRIIIIGLVVLVVSQSLLSTDSMRLYLSWAERLEGEPLSSLAGSSARVMETPTGVFAHVTVELEDYSSLAKAVLLINGEKAADFINRKVIVKVYPDDVIEIDGSFYQRLVKFKVTDVSPSIAEPAAGKIVETYQNSALLGKVRFK